MNRLFIFQPIKKFYLDFAMNLFAPLFKVLLFEALKLSGWKKNVLRKNLDDVRPEMTELQKENFRNRLLKNLSSDAVDFLTKGWIYSKGDSRFSIDEKSLSVLNKMKQGGLMLTAHFGNYEAIGPWLVRLGIPLMASYARLKPKILDKWIYSRYRSIDNVHYSLFINNPRKILKLLDQGNLFCLIADQDFRKARFVPGTLFGKPVHCNPIPAFILKYRPKTPIYLCWIESGIQTKTLFVKEIQPTNEKELYQNFHAWLEKRIHLSPEKWYGWVHRRFLSTKQKV